MMTYETFHIALIGFLVGSKRSKDIPERFMLSSLLGPITYTQSTALLIDLDYQIFLKVNRESISTL